MSVELTPAEIEYILLALLHADSNFQGPGPRLAAARRLGRSLARRLSRPLGEKLLVELALQVDEMAGKAKR